MATVCPDWKELSDKVGDLCRRRDEIHAEMREIDTRVSWRDAITFNTDRPLPDITTTPKPKPLRKALLEKLGRFAPEQAPVPPPLPEGEPDPRIRISYKDPMAARRHELGKELDTIEAALAILHPQLAQAYQQGSKALCAAVMPEYRAVARRLSLAVIAVVEAVAEHDRFTGALMTGGANPVFLRMPDVEALRPMFGDPRPGKHGALAREWLAWVVQCGHLNSTDIPSWWSEPDAEQAVRHAAIVAASIADKRPKTAKGDVMYPPRMDMIGGRVVLVPGGTASEQKAVYLRAWEHGVPR
jgi:hypothetical protein